MTEQTQSPLKIGDWFVEPSLGRISHGDRRVSVAPRPMDLLLLLASRPNDVVSFDDIIDGVWGGALVSDSSIYNTVNDLRRALDDDRASPRYIETVSRRGYRLIADVDPEASLLPSGAEATPPAQAGAWTRRAAVAARVLAIVGIVLASSLGPREEPATEIEIKVPEGRLKNSVAVLPFENLSPDPDNAYFAAGVHEEVLNQLARNRELAVIARTSVMQYQNARRPIADIAAELNVEMVLEGSVRYDGDRFRITAQLIDGHSGAQLWSEAYDGTLTDIFQVQADIASGIANAMVVQVDGGTPHVAARPTESLDAYVHYVKARSMIGTLGNKDSVHNELDAALALDPKFAVAIALKAMVKAYEATIEFGGETLTAIEEATLVAEAEALARRALDIDPGLSEAYVALGFVDRYNRRWDQSFDNFETAYRLDPSALTTVAPYANELGARGRIEEMIRLRELAITIDPLNPVIRMGLAINLMWAQRYGQARDVFLQLAEMVPALATPYALLAATESCDANREGAIAAAWKAEERPLSIDDQLLLIGIYRRNGMPEDSARLYADMEAGGLIGSLGARNTYRLYKAIGDYDAAMDVLNEMIDTNHPPRVAHFHRFYWDRAFCGEPTDHPGFQQALRKLGATS